MHPADPRTDPTALRPRIHGTVYVQSESELLKFLPARPENQGSDVPGFIAVFVCHTTDGDGLAFSFVRNIEKWRAARLWTGHVRGIVPR